MNFKKRLVEAGIEILSKFGIFRSYRFFYRASGFTEEELKRPLIAVANTYMESTLGHMHLKEIGECVKAGIYLAGGLPVEFNTIGPCGGYAREKRFITDAMYYDLPQREAIADSVEVQVKNLAPDGLVCIGTCDKSIPGLWLASARLNLPTVFVTGGPSLPGFIEGENTTFPTEILDMAVSFYRKGEKGIIQLRNFIRECEACWVLTAGSCPEMTTANTVQMATEVMGLCLPGSSTVPAVFNERREIAKISGMLAVRLAREKKRFSDFVTKEAILDALRVTGAVGGGTNGVLHLLTLSRAMGFSLTLDEIEDVMNSTPLIGAFKPSGPHSIFDLHNSGGIPGVLKVLLPLLSKDRLTVSGRTIKEIAEEAKVDSQILKSMEEPVEKRSAIYVLRGNLAPGGALARPTVKGAVKYLRGKAKTFNSQEDAISSIIAGEVKSGEIIVLRYQGPRGGPGFVENFQVALIAMYMGLKDIAVITDGRFSGATFGCLYVGYVSPEAQVGGPIALVRNGDEVEIDVEKRSVNLLISPEEMERRKKEWSPPPPRFTRGVLLDWFQNASQFPEGATLKR